MRIKMVKHKNSVLYLLLSILIVTTIHCCRDMTKNEFIIPLTTTTKTLGLYRRPSNVSQELKIKHSIPNMDASVSIRPSMAISEKEIEARLVNRK